VITFNAMTGIVHEVPLKLVSVAVGGLFAAAVLTLMFGWHGLRRLLDVPHVPRPRGIYLALGALWIALVVTGSMSVGTILLLRDHQRVGARTQLAEVRCEAVGAGHVRAEVRTSFAVAPEQYDFAGDACPVWVRQIELRPGLGILGVGVLSRIESVGPIRRPAANVDRTARPLVDLVTRRTEIVAVSVPPDAQERSLLVSSLGGPTLDRI